MLHELLLVLSGHESDLFVHVQKGPQSSLQLAKDLPFLHESERVMINNLCRLGVHCRRLKQYTDTHRLISPAVLSATSSHHHHQHHHRNRSSIGVLSMYKKSICVGIDEILEKYQETLLQVEQDFHRECQQNSGDGSRGKIVLPLPYLVHMLRDYETLFTELCDAVDMIESQGLRGGSLLDFVHRKSFSGTPLIKHAMERLLFHCNVVMIRHITAWVVFGRLVDRFDEFFIEEVSPQESLQQQQQQDTVDMDVDGIVDTKTDDVHETETAHSWKQWFKLRMPMIPSYISPHLANKILFVGKAIKVLQKSSCPLPTAATSIAFTRADIISRSELHKFSEALQVHEQAQVLHIPSFEYTVDRIRDAVARHLWNLIVVESNLLEHLSMLKNFFLLSKGDFFQCLIEDSHQLMSATPLKNAEQDVRLLFQRAARKMYDEENQEEFKDFNLQFEKNNVRITSAPTSTSSTLANFSMISGVSSGTHSSENAKHETFDAWCNLSLQYEAKWPLHLLIDQDVINLYNSLFRFLFVVKRVQFSLQQAWSPLVRQRVSSPMLLKPLLMLRSRMGFFIDNLQFYLHVDVIAVQFKNLEDTILASKDFETVKRAHDIFLNTLIVQCFLNPQTNENQKQIQSQDQQMSQRHQDAGNRDTVTFLNTSIATASSATTGAGGSSNLRQQIMAQLDLIFRHCMTLCYIVEKEESRKQNPNSQKKPFESDELKYRVSKLSREFDFELDCLFKILSVAKYPHLQQLMLRIDYNKYLSSGGRM